VPSLTPGAARNEEDEGDLGSEERFVHTRRDGTRRHIALARAAFQLQDHEFQLVHARDVSREKQVEKQLREAQTLEAVGRLVGRLAHDFNNLLTGIMLYCDLLIAELEEVAAADVQVNRIMLLVITPSAKARGCAQAIQQVTSEETHVVTTSSQALAQLRAREYVAVLIDQAFVETEPVESDRCWNTSRQPFRFM
jgi:signal transduction histidine kinase